MKLNERTKLVWEKIRMHYLTTGEPISTKRLAEVCDISYYEMRLEIVMLNTLGYLENVESGVRNSATVPKNRTVNVDEI